jgi:hypothetical protein
VRSPGATHLRPQDIAAVGHDRAIELRKWRPASDNSRGGKLHPFDSAQGRTDDTLNDVRGRWRNTHDCSTLARLDRGSER